MLTAFIHIRLLDVIDIIFVAILLYQIYMLIRGTVAFNIFLGIAAIYVFWWAVRALKMELLSSIIGQVIGVGVIALIIVFQQEIINQPFRMRQRPYERDVPQLGNLVE